MRRRYVIIIGAMKSGTTTLFDAMARHPEISPCLNKEPGFFAFDEVWDQGFDWFDTLYEDFDPAKHRYRMEASTDYTKTPFVTGVWEKMTANPDVEVKLIYIMRHPFRRIESHAHHTQRKKKEIGQEISPRPDHAFDAGFSPVSLSVSAYATQLDAFEEARAAGNLHCLTLEEFLDEPGQTMADIWAFLGLDPLPDDDRKKAPSNAAALKTRPHPVLRTLTAIGPLLALAKTVLPRPMRDAIKDRLDRKVEAEGRFKLTAAEESLLKALYRDDLARLRDSYGIDTEGQWGL